MGRNIQETSSLYKALCERYENQDLTERFLSCYTLVEQATYEEIHYIITMIKEFNWDDEVKNINIAGIVDISSILNFFKILCADKVIRRNAFLMDILEEARNRKRPSIT